MIKLLGALVLLTSCIHTTGTVQSDDTVCSTEYRPHLCLATIGGATYGGYGSNRCFARKRLLENLERAKVSSAVESDIQCGEVAE